MICEKCRNVCEKCGQPLNQLGYPYMPNSSMPLPNSVYCGNSSNSAGGSHAINYRSELNNGGGNIPNRI